MKKIFLFPKDIKKEELEEAISFMKKEEVFTDDAVVDFYDMDSLIEVVSNYRGNYEKICIVERNREEFLSIMELLRKIGIERLTPNMDIGVLDIKFFYDKQKIEEFAISNAKTIDKENQDKLFFELFFGLLLDNKEFEEEIKTIMDKKDKNGMFVLIYDTFETEESITVIFNVIWDIDKRDMLYVTVIHDKIEDKVIEYKISKNPFDL